MKSMMESALLAKGLKSGPKKMNLGRTKLGIGLFLIASIFQALGDGQMCASMPQVCFWSQIAGQIVAPWLIVVGIYDKGGK